VLATGVEDAFPDIPGFEELYGTSIFHCPCCDGYEARDKDVLAIGWGEHVSGFTLDLLEWGARVSLATNGRAFEGDDASSQALRRNEIEIYEEKIARFEVEGGAMTAVVLASGDRLPASLAFFSIEHRPRTDLASQLGCALDDDGYLTVDAHGETSVPGVYAAGDVTPGEQLVQVAAAHGAIAGIACAMSLRGGVTAPGAPDPGPDPETEIASGVERL
jgi:thioredoxin reductase